MSRHSKKEAKKRRNRKRQKRSKPKKSPFPSTTMAPRARRNTSAIGFTDDSYRSPADLVVLGPIINGYWMNPTAKEAALREAGKQVPQPVVGQLLIDTGASTSCISQEVADQLGLIPVSVNRSFGAHGQRKALVYRARIGLSVLENNERFVMEIEKPVLAVVDLQKSAHPDATYRGAPLNFVGLLGRDFLAHMKLTYDGPRGRFRFEIDRKSVLKISSGKPRILQGSGPPMSVFQQQAPPNPQAFDEARARLYQLQVGVYDGKPSDVCFTMAHKYLSSVADILGGHSTPSLAPLPDGSAIAFEWEYADRELHVEIGEGDEFGYLMVSRDVDVDEGEQRGIETQREMASWLMTGGKPPALRQTE